MKDVSRLSPTNLFVLRLWQEPLDEQRSEWRGEIKNVSSGEVRYFRTWEEIASLVPEMLYRDVGP